MNRLILWLLALSSVSCTCHVANPKDQASLVICPATHVPYAEDHFLNEEYFPTASPSIMPPSLLILQCCWQVLQRISFLLKSPVYESATTPLLAILQAYARAGADTARAVWQCPGMQQGLLGILKGKAEGRTTGGAANAMAVIRLLASVSHQMTQAVAASGLPLDIKVDSYGTCVTILGFETPKQKTCKTICLSDWICKTQAPLGPLHGNRTSYWTRL